MDGNRRALASRPAAPATLVVALISGVLSGFGLALSTMIKPEVVLSFLRFQDFGSLLVLTLLSALLRVQLVKFIPGTSVHRSLAADLASIGHASAHWPQTSSC